MAKTCDHCKHWMREERGEYDSDAAMTARYAKYAYHKPGDLERALAKAAELDHWGTCAMMTGPTWEEREDGTLAVAEDGSSYRASVRTRENFGCVMFVGKG